MSWAKRQNDGTHVLLEWLTNQVCLFCMFLQVNNLIYRHHMQAKQFLSSNVYQLVPLVLVGTSVYWSPKQVSCIHIRDQLTHVGAGLRDGGNGPVVDISDRNKLDPSELWTSLLQELWNPVAVEAAPVEIHLPQVLELQQSLKHFKTELEISR